MMMNLDNIKMQQVDNNNSSVNENSNNFNLNHNSAMKTSSATIEHRDEKMCEHTVQKTDKQQVSKYDTDPLLRDIMNKINSTEKVLITPKRNFGRRYLKKLESSTNNDDFKSNNNNNNDSNTNEHQTKSAALSDDRNFEYFNLESSSSSLKQSTIPEQQNENNSYIDYSNSMLNRFAYFDIHNNSSISTTNSYSKNYFEYQRNETLRRQELLKQNANLVNLFAKTKYTEIEEEEIECDNNINNNNKNIDEIVDKNDENIDDQIKIDNKVIKTFSADESVAEIEIDNFQPQFAKDIDFEILKHPVSRQFRYTSNENNRIETMTDSKNRNNPKKTNNTKSSGKKKESSSKKISLKVPETSKNRLKFIPLSLEDKFDSVKTIDKSETKSKSLPESLDQIMYLNKSATNCLNNDENKNNNIANKSREMSSLTSKSKSSPDFAKIQKTAEKYAKYLTPTKKKNDEKSGSGSVKKNPEFKIHNITVNKRIYQVLNQIGRGGSSIVYQVYSPDTKKTLALKKVNLNNADKAVVDGFRSEINLLKRLRRCQRVVRMYDYEFLNGNKELLIVMEKGDADLSQVLKSHHQLSSKLSPHVIRLYWQEMLEAVKEIHDAQIVHADLKLVNFILVSGTLKLIDFGIANTIQSNQTNVYKDVIVGTVDYMAPESFLKRSEHQNKVKYNQKVDIWSLGIILYTLVYGHTPFSHLGSDMIKKGMAIVNADIQYEPIDDDLVLDVIKKCLQKDPKKRANPDELLQHRYLTLKNGENSTNSPTNGNSEAKRVNDNNNIPPELLSQMSKLSPNTLKSFSKFVTKLAQK